MESIYHAEAGTVNETSTPKATVEATHVHYHKDARGILHKCYHKCRTSLSDAGFWIGLTLGFPIEHFLYEKVWPFTFISHALGLN